MKKTIKKEVKKLKGIKIEKPVEPVEEKIVETFNLTREGIYEMINGYSIVANGEFTEFVGDKVIAFNEAVKAYKLKKCV